jgi:phospholipid transport system substrate-binding protein
MRFSPVHTLLIVLPLLVGSPAAAIAAEPPATATAQSLCDALIAAMKSGSSMGFAARRDSLAAEIQRDFDLPFMTRLVVGPPWRDLAEGERQKLAEVFSAYSIATYAQRFNSYSGEHFSVDPTPAPMANGDCVVHTKLFTGDPQPVQLDYLMREKNHRWQIIDVYLNGTVSEMAARRSEYSTVLREGGAPALIKLLTKKTAELADQRPGSS